MSDVHDEDWCDRQLICAQRVLHYLDVREKLVMQRVRAVQVAAHKRAVDAVRVLRDFQDLMSGRGAYGGASCDFEPEAPQSQLQAGLTASGPSGMAPAAMVQTHSSTTEGNVMSQASASDDQNMVGTNAASTGREWRSTPQLRDPVRSPAHRRQNAARAEDDAGGRATVLARPSDRLVHAPVRAPPSAAALRYDNRRRTSSNGASAVSAGRQSLVARELSEARLRVLNRRKIVADRKKNASVHIAASGMRAVHNRVGSNSAADSTRPYARTPGRGHVAPATQYSTSKQRLGESSGSIGQASRTNASVYADPRLAPNRAGPGSRVQAPTQLPLASRPLNGRRAPLGAGRVQKRTVANAAPPLHRATGMRPTSSRAVAHARIPNSPAEPALEVHVGPRRFVPPAARAPRPPHAANRIASPLHSILES